MWLYVDMLQYDTAKLVRILFILKPLNKILLYIVVQQIMLKSPIELELLKINLEFNFFIIK
jgi:hypothetical protein